MNHDDQTAKGRFLEADQYAIVLTPDGNIELTVPNQPSKGTPGHQLFTAILIALHDPEWVDYMIKSLKPENQNPHTDPHFH